MQDSGDFTEFVTFTIAGQMFGLPIGRVQDVFKPAHVTRVPLAGSEIAGVLNLRGRIVTIIDMRNRLDLPARADDRAPMAIGIETRSESFGLLVDAVGEVLELPDAAPRTKSDQSRPQARRRIRGGSSARRAAARRSRRRPRAGFARRGGRGMTTNDNERADARAA